MRFLKFRKKPKNFETKKLQVGLRLLLKGYMKITLHVEPNTPPLTWEEFLKVAPEGSIAIDGYVSGAPRWDGDKRILCINHHEGCDRLTTRCTAAQASILIKSGLLKAFNHGLEEVHLFVNDCDEDVTLTVWLFLNAHHTESIINPILNRIINVEDMLDTTAGSYGYPANMPALHENNWLFQAYKIARTNGALERRDEREFRMIIGDGCLRISQAVAGRGEEIPLDTDYEVMNTNTGWSMVREIGLNARLGMYSDGVDAFVSVTARTDGKFTYSVGRRSIFIPFPLPEVLKKLDEIERNPNHHWGGSDTIGGSPRATGSRLTPPEVRGIIEKVVEEYNAGHAKNGVS